MFSGTKATDGLEDWDVEVFAVEDFKINDELSDMNLDDLILNRLKERRSEAINEINDKGKKWFKKAFLESLNLESVYGRYYAGDKMRNNVDTFFNSWSRDFLRKIIDKLIKQFANLSYTNYYDFSNEILNKISKRFFKFVKKNKLKFYTD